MVLKLLLFNVCSPNYSKCTWIKPTTTCMSHNFPRKLKQEQTGQFLLLLLNYIVGETGVCVWCVQSNPVCGLTTCQHPKISFDVGSPGPWWANNLQWLAVQFNLMCNRLTH